ncbi:MAG: carbohydrate ABC transporter substrate-binding protein [Bauldia sp.]|uniref:ABC transporter substrate-binding protein n=1 Tax=Bauldia sp. TaxID=2575872 RepID=UPI001DBB73CD|nr:ABC transporter substrate-binding protein [Bauldia sp.]MCB1495845.1 carbohydrate ABC transporter substrate-binding protein [Bauldia sp.]
MKKLLLSTTAIALSAIFAASADAEDTTVTYRSWSPVIQTLQKMVQSTEAAIPGIKIDVKTFNYPEYLVDLQTRANAGEMPDIVGLEPGALTQQYREYLAPAQDCAASVWGDDWQSKFYPLAIEQARLGNPSGDENFYGLPVLTQTINLWYTVPVMEDLGLAPPTTYDELKALAEAARAAGYAPMMIGAGDGWIRRDVYMQLIHNVAPGLIYKAEAGEVPWTDERFVEAMQIWKNMFDDGIFQDGALGLSHYPGAVEVIESGRAATFPMGAWWQQQAAVDNPTPLSKNLSGYAAFKFPDVTGQGAPDDLLGGIDVMIGISKDADYDAACKVLTDWIGGAGAQTLINTFNDLPAFVGLRPEKFGSDNQEAVWDMFTKEWLPTVKYARQLASPEVKQALEDALAAVAAGDKTPEEGMAMVQQAYDSSKG